MEKQQPSHSACAPTGLALVENLEVLTYLGNASEVPFLPEFKSSEHSCDPLGKGSAKDVVIEFVRSLERALLI